MISRSEAAAFILLIAAGLSAMMYAGITGAMPFGLSKPATHSCPQQPTAKD